LPPILIPVTGADLTAHGLAANLYPRLFINLGIGFVGLGLIFHGVSKRLDRGK
jgi:hypothetical protein